MRRLAGLVISTFGAACQLGVWHDPHQPILRLEAATPFPVQRTMGLQLVVDGQVSNVLLLREGKQLATLTPPAYAYVWDSGNEAEGSYRLKATARTASGETVASNEVTVVIDRTGPDVVSYAPATGADPVLLPLTVEFSEPLLRASVAASALTVFRNDVPIEFDVSLSADSLTLTVTPTPAVRGAYRVVLSESLTDLAGNRLRVPPSAASWQRVLVPPGPVTSLNMQAFTNAVRVEWSAPSDDGGSPLEGYQVRSTGNVGRPPSYFIDLRSWPANSPLFSDGAWIPRGRTVTFTVSAVTAVGEGPGSVASVVMPSYDGTLIVGHSAVTLDSGLVLVAGGLMQNSLDTCEFGCPHTMLISLYDPETGFFAPASEQQISMPWATSAPLADGRVLVALGSTSGANVYDPVKKSFTLTGPPPHRPFTGIATPLKDGRVLLGSLQGFLTADETGPTGTLPLQVYEPASDTFVELDSPPEASTATRFAVLPSGEVLLAGDGPTGSTAVLFNPGPSGARQFSFKTLGPMLDFRGSGTATTLSDGRVLFAGGLSAPTAVGPLPTSKSCEIYDPAQGTFSRAHDLLAGRRDHTATLLADGRVVFVGGTDDGTDSVEIYDPTTGGMSAPDLKCARAGHTVNRIPGNRLLLMGGSGTYLGTVSGLCPEEIYPLPVAFAGAMTMRPLAGLVVCTLVAACELGVSHDPRQPSLRLEASTPFPVQRSIGLQVIAQTEVSDVQLFREGERLTTLAAPGYSYVWDAGNEAEGTYRFTASARAPSGETVRSNEVAAVIDRTGPEAVSYTPLTGPDPVVAPFTIGFSEPLLRASVSRSGLTLFRDGLQVDFDFALSADGISLTVTPAAAIRGAYRLELSQALTDLAGNPLHVPLSAPSWQRVVAPPGPVTSVMTDAFTNVARVRWSPPLDDGGSPVTSYLVRVGPRVTNSEFIPQIPAQPPGWPLDWSAVWYPRGTTVSFTVSAVSGAAEGPSTVATVVMPSYTGTLMYGHSAVALDSGKVLVVGGTGVTPESQCYPNCPETLRSSIYDPETGKLQIMTTQWVTILGAVAAPLGDGRVLVAGGYTGGRPVGRIFDPTTSLFTVTGSPPHDWFGTATPLKDGRVLLGSLISPFQNDHVASQLPLEIYEPAAGTFFELDSPREAWAAHLFAVMPSGDVLLAGCLFCGFDRVLAAKVLNPGPAGARQFSFKEVGPMLAAHITGTATVLSDGRVLLAGGGDKSCEIYDPAQGTFTRAADLLVPRSGHTATLLDDGRVLFAGGGSISAEIYDPVSGGVAAPDLACPRMHHTASRIPGNKLLLVGGEYFLDPPGSLCPEEVYPLP